MSEPIILLVEDNEDDITLAQLALARAGHPHSLVVARDGAEALDYLVGTGAREETPAVVLLDLKLPKVDGKIVLRTVRGTPRTARVPVVVLTSSRLSDDVLDAYVLGANSYYQKPMDFRSFTAGMEVLLTYWFQYNVGATPTGTGLSLGVTPRTGAGRIAALPAIHGMPSAGVECVIIDGNATERAATAAALQADGAGPRILELGTFVEASDYLRTLGGPSPHTVPELPRIFFVDLDLPGGDARDILHALRYRCDHHVFLVVYTRAVSSGLVNEVYRLKPNSLVCKPEDDAAYRETVRIVWHYWVGMNVPPPPPGSEKATTPRPG